MQAKFSAGNQNSENTNNFSVASNENSEATTTISLDICNILWGTANSQNTTNFWRWFCKHNKDFRGYKRIFCVDTQPWEYEQFFLRSAINENSVTQPRFFWIQANLLGNQKFWDYEKKIFSAVAPKNIVYITRFPWTQENFYSKKHSSDNMNKISFCWQLTKILKRNHDFFFVISEFSG